MQYDLLISGGRVIFTLLERRSIITVLFLLSSGSEVDLPAIRLSFPILAAAISAGNTPRCLFTINIMTQCLPMIKLILMDVDGTITDSRRRLSVSAIDAIRAAQDNGILVSLVSGNVIQVMYSLMIYLGLNAPVFGENGGIMMNNLEVTPFFSRESPEAFFNEIVRLKLADDLLTNRWRETSMGYFPLPGTEAAIKRLAPKFNVEITNSGFSWHILNVGQNKGFALHYLMERYDLRPDEVLVIGDNFNDIPMFIEGVRKAVPANAEEELKKRADYIARSGYGDGSAEILSSLESF